MVHRVALPWRGSLSSGKKKKKEKKEKKRRRSKVEGVVMGSSPTECVCNLPIKKIKKILAFKWTIHLYLTCYLPFWSYPENYVEAEQVNCKRTVTDTTCRFHN
jgi:hypothetical protein